MKEVGVGVAILVMLVCSAVVWFKAPCGLYAFSKAGEVPARCVMK